MEDLMLDPDFAQEFTRTLSTKLKETKKALEDAKVVSSFSSVAFQTHIEVTHLGK